ncbi:MAG: hypothetical protein M3409_10985 [Gemmatimonadota bacterium]|nr:hypothetical protein [Gemmatimonadota bacterium]
MRLRSLAAVLVTTACTLAFARGQNRGTRVGGGISPAKVLWLNHTLLAFFVVPALLLRDPSLHPRTRRVLRAQLESFAARAAVELWMLYRTRSWRVAYGVGHDLAHLGLLRVLRAGSTDTNARRHLRSIEGSLLAEVLFATLFHRAVEGNTRGSDAIYFASTDPRFRRINLLTSMINTAAYWQLGRVIVGQTDH